MCDITQRVSNYYTVKCQFLRSIWKKLHCQCHWAEIYTGTAYGGAVTNIRYVPAWATLEGWPRIKEYFKELDT